jgi:hypothetical protein
MVNTQLTFDFFEWPLMMMPNKIAELLQNGGHFVARCCVEQLSVRNAC